MKIAGELVVALGLVLVIFLCVVALWVYELRYFITIGGIIWLAWRYGAVDAVHKAIVPRRSDTGRKGKS